MNNNIFHDNLDDSSFTKPFYSNREEYWLYISRLYLGSTFSSEAISDMIEVYMGYRITGVFNINGEIRDDVCTAMLAVLGENATKLQVIDLINLFEPKSYKNTMHS